MRQIFHLLILISPFGMIAQTDIETKNVHQHSVTLLMANNPQAQKVNLSVLKEEQKGLHEKCKTCGNKKSATNKNSIPLVSENTLSQLKINQDKIIALVKDVLLNSPSESDLLEKYKQALTLNQQQIRLAESQIANQKKVQKEIEIKESK